MSEEWEQTEVIHCPDRKCEGMLLSNIYEVYYLCSDCNKKWYTIIEWREYK